VGKPSQQLKSPHTAPEPSGPVSFQGLLDSKTTHTGQAQVKSNTITERSEPGSSGSDLLFFNSELTRGGCRRRCRDMSGLSLCLCGESVHPGDVGSIRCQRTGCETTWVSTCVNCTGSRLNQQLSIIFAALGMRIQGLDIGLVRRAH